MSKQAFQEDDVLEIVAEALRQKGFLILAVGGNQAGLFRFHTGAGKRKAPDLVAYREPLLIVGEAKVRASALFTNQGIGESDFMCMDYLSKSMRAQREIIDNVKRVLGTLKLTPPELFTFKTALIAATKFPSHASLKESPDMILLQVNQQTESLIVIKNLFII
jgi:hypothetical protein